jgi:predicted signal transduction protein with EAL and GGDEF domain
VRGAAAFLGADPAMAAACWVLLAAAWCLARWVLRGATIESGLSVSLVIGGDRARAQRLPRRPTGCGRGRAGAASVLYASYRMAFMDALTGLPNRRALDETLSRLDRRFGLAMVDVDHFKRFNDTYGHAAGDLVLASVAHEIRRAERRLRVPLSAARSSASCSTASTTPPRSRAATRRASRWRSGASSCPSPGA